jgi:hypothetical protein
VNKIMIGLAFALLANGISSSTYAQPVTTIDPSSVASGTNVTGAYAGVTLLTVSLNQDPVGFLPSGEPLLAPIFGSVYSVTGGASTPCFGGSVFSSSPTFNDTYGNMLGGIDGSCFTACPLSDSSEGFAIPNLLVEFASPVSAVSILDLTNVNNGIYMEAFNSSNQIVGSCITDVGVAQPDGNYGCYSVLNNGFEDSGGYVQETSLQSSGGISKILIGGDSNVGNISAIKYTSFAAPEIDPTSAASGMMLMLGGLLVLRGRRPMGFDRAT